MTTDAVRVDYYAVLQVQPNAEVEVIEAAYRQLMKKHHPDRAGAEHLEQAKAINAAFSVLRDPEQRRRYDAERLYRGTRPPPAASSTHTTGRPTQPPPTPPAAPPTPAPATPIVVAPESTPWAPLAALMAAYYLLPGPYEWESGGLRELVTVVLIPAYVAAAYALASGRLAAWLGHSMTMTSSVMAWCALAVLVVVSMWGKLLRVALATAPSLALFSGTLRPALDQAHIPLWLAWILVTSLSLAVAARLYVFGVLPALCLCWLITRLA